ncbi:MAG: hypothetical protein H3C27_08600 [Opitutaceae bacterium]|nr:hypothetical protein [Opitutaceae bacterium]
MPHRAIIGQTGSGKTHCARATAKTYRAAGTHTLVLHKPREVWPADCASWQTDDPARFLRMFWASRGCACFMELADADVSKWDTEFHRCFTQGRHEGHRCYYLSQRAAQVHPNIRENCESLCLFSVGRKAAKLWAEEFNDDALLGAVHLQPHWFWFKPSRYAPAQLLKLS